MKTILRSTEVRKEWSKVCEDVIREKPALVKRNRDFIAMLSLEMLDYLLSEYKLTADVRKEKSLMPTLKELRRFYEKDGRELMVISHKFFCFK